MSTRHGDQTADRGELAASWDLDPRWAGIRRTHTAEDVVALRGSVREESTLAQRGAERLWQLLHSRTLLPALGALTGNQAVQQVRAGLEAIYLSGWQVAADANLSGQTYPDQSLYPVNSVPAVVRRINNALLRADQIEFAENGRRTREWLAPIVADAEAGFGGPLNAYELMHSMIAAGAAGVHWEDQLAAEKKCGHLGGKVLVPTSQHVRTLSAARLAADVAGVPTVIVARTDALGADLLTSDVDPRDEPFLTGERTAEGYYRVRTGPRPRRRPRRGVRAALRPASGWRRRRPTSTLAIEFAERIHDRFPGKLLAYNCSPSFHWRSQLDDAQIARFQRELAGHGYVFQFITLAGFHALNHSMFDLARGYAERGMSAYVELQEAEIASETDGYTATRHQREVGTGYFDRVATAISPEQRHPRARRLDRDRPVHPLTSRVVLATSRQLH